MPKSVTFYSEGVKLAGDLLLPADIKPGERRAGIVLCHGYTGLRSIYLPDNARVLAQAGYVVLTFDYKGWGDSDVAAAGEKEKGIRSARLHEREIGEVAGDLTA